MITSKTSDFFEVGVRYAKTQEDGTEKNVTERYVIDALSFAEAEATITKEMEAYISGDYKITSEAQANYHEVVLDDSPNADKYYKAKVAFITIDERTEKEKRSNVNYLVQAANLGKAVVNINDFFCVTTLDYVIVSIAETRVMDIFFHEEKQEKDGNGTEVAAD